MLPFVDGVYGDADLIYQQVLAHAYAVKTTKC